MMCAKYILFLFGIIVHTDGLVICGPNEHLVRCAQTKSCQPTCANPDQFSCVSLSCIRGCECNEGYVRGTNKDDDNSCIKIDQCPNKINSTCGINEIQSSCANPCQPSCTEPERKPCRTKICSKGCVCKVGFIRTSDDATSACVLNDQCPDKQIKKTFF